MKYWLEFTSRLGFNSGTEIPLDARVAREVYVRAVNKAAELLGSNYRVVAADAKGLNTLMIAFILKNEARHLHSLTKGVSLSGLRDTAQIDEAMMLAVEKVMDEDVDEFVIVDVNIARTFSTFLVSMKANPAYMPVEETHTTKIWLEE